MGYYSNAAIAVDFRNEYAPVPWTPAERTMRWLARRWALMERSKELEDRASDLIMCRWMQRAYHPDSPHGPEERESTEGLCMEETEYVLPEYLYTEEDVWKAIALIERKIADMDREEMLARKQDEQDAADIRYIPGQTVLELEELRADPLLAKLGA